MAKKTNKQKIAELEGFITQTLAGIGEEKLLNYLSFSLKEDLKRLDKDIEDEANFAKENPPRSTYGGAGTEARQRVKYLKRVRKYRCELIRKFDLCIKMKNRVDKMW